MQVCVLHTVEALLVDYGAAGQGFIILLVTHQGVHAQDGWKTARGQRMKRTNIRKGKVKERVMLTVNRLNDCVVAAIRWTTMLIQAAQKHLNCKQDKLDTDSFK